ncbi:MAG: hypothetical protein QOI78_5539 [Actinomycetota bacterium]|nr:hypothetical protein [Actinomycetota bacterium]
MHGNNTQEARLLQVRAAALRERVAGGQAGPADHMELTKTLYGVTLVPDSGVTGQDVLAAARLARRAAPHDPEVLEVLALGLLVAGDTGELAGTLRELEQRAPHSKVLAVLREAHTDPARHDRSAARVEHMRDVARRALGGDRAAEAELRLEAQKFPLNHQYRVDLIFAVHHRGDHAETRRLCDELAADPAAGHLAHFHLAQVYWLIGDRPRGRHHFRLAVETAGDDADREDVRLAMRTVGAGSPEEPGLG